jgi:hypothetical protein
MYDRPMRCAIVRGPLSADDVVVGTKIVYVTAAVDAGHAVTSLQDVLFLEVFATAGPSTISLPAQSATVVHGDAAARSGARGASATSGSVAGAGALGGVGDTIRHVMLPCLLADDAATSLMRSKDASAASTPSWEAAAPHGSDPTHALVKSAAHFSTLLREMAVHLQAVEIVPLPSADAAGVCRCRGAVGTSCV